MADFIPRNAHDFVQHENAKLKEENETLKSEVRSLRQFVLSLDRLYHVTDSLKDDSQLFPFLRNTLANAMKLLNAPDGSLALLDEDTQELVFVIVIGQLADELTNQRISVKEGIAGWVVQNAKPALVPNVRSDPRFFSGVDDTHKFKTQSIAAAPLVGNRKTFGIIEVLNHAGNEPFTTNDLGLLKLLCRATGEALAYIDQMPSER
ncbi:MAG: GAF domain-containing protein [Anaerolineae bacterium]|nr:GAF domain-containing protein [Anaerolineae bacterium]MDQ7036502.1 GAF domain-containing protein [Anaerolineae bacterium]